jgi:IS30 family transposase
MTIKQKYQIEKMKNDGYSLKAISEELNVSLGTVKSYLARKDAIHHCEQCGKVIQPKSRKNRFCSDRCRMNWWREHRDESEKTNSQVCPVCNQTFVTYPSKHQVYCSRKCAGKARWTNVS